MAEAKKNCNNSMWVQFFQKAGIPHGVDSKYAVIFEDNRIKMDMLMDIDKEILKDMGITVMGDIIAILKQAKILYKELSHKADLEKANSNGSQSPSVNSEQVEVKKVLTTTMTTSPRTTASPKKIETSSVEPQASTSKFVLPNSPPMPLITVGSGSILQRLSTSSTSTKVSDSSGTLRKTVTVDPDPDRNKRNMILLKRASPEDGPLIQREEVPVQKKIRVLPEHEGKYRIKHPDGTHPRTRKLLEERLGSPPASKPTPDTSEKKNSVFARLGQGRNNEPKDLNVSNNHPGRPRARAVSPVTPLSESSKGSIFERLGTQYASKDEHSRLMSTKFEVPRSTGPRKEEKTLTTIHSRLTHPLGHVDDVAALRSSDHSPLQSSRMRADVFMKEQNEDRVSIKSRLDEKPTSSRMVNQDSSSSLLSSRVHPSVSSSTKIISTSKRTGISAKPGTVLKEERLRSATTGKCIVRRTIVKRITKSSPSDEFE